MAHIDDIREIDRQVMAAEWPLDEDGYPHRAAARVVMISPDEKIFMILGHDVDDPSFRWWFTPGGGMIEGENPREAAVRELHEETGLAVLPARLEGPVLSRQSTFRFVGSTRKQDELFFLLRVTDQERALVDSEGGTSLTLLEKEVLDTQEWFSPQELARMAADGVNVFPEPLPQWAAQWIAGWDGTLLDLVEDSTDK